MNKENIFKKDWVKSLISVAVIFSSLFVILFLLLEKDKVFVENSYLDAPIVNLSPTSPGVLNALYVKEGDYVLANTQIALVGSQIIYTKNNGIVSYAPSVVGSYFSPGQVIVSIINNSEMKVVGEIDETKGLDKIKKGQNVIFTIDTFGSKKYKGIVEEISPTSNENGVVFSISDKRAVKKFNIKVIFNINDYPELKNGMSAKMTIYTK